MTKENKATKKVSKAKSVKVNYNQFDLIIDLGLAYENEMLKNINIETAEKAAEEKRNHYIWVYNNSPWYKKAWFKVKKLFNR